MENDLQRLYIISYTELAKLSGVGIVRFGDTWLKGIWRIFMTSRLKRFEQLIARIEHFNALIEKVKYHFDVLDQLKRVGNPVKIRTRGQIIDALEKMRKDLVRAVQTERILRENPDFKPEELSFDSIPLLGGLGVDDQAKECERLINEALEIGLEVQKEMNLLNPPINAQMPPSNSRQSNKTVTNSKPKNAGQPNQSPQQPSQQPSPEQKASEQLIRMLKNKPRP